MPEQPAGGLSTPSGSDRRTLGTAEFDELRDLLFGPELAKISQLSKRLNDPEVRARDVGEVLATAKVRKSLDQIIRSILKREPEVVIDVIKPVLLVAVRKAVSDALREFSESLNQIAEKSLSFRSLRWRLEAWRTGRKFSDIMLSRSLLYSVREVFLIHGRTGIMLNQAAREAVTKDPDMISSMFTAIQEFVRDSFIGSENSALETIDAGSLKLWIQHGSYAMVAGAVDGTPPVELKTVFRGALNEIQAGFRAELESFQGDVGPFEKTRPILEKCLLGKSAAERKRPVLLWLVAAVSLGLLVAVAVFGTLHHLRLSRYLENVERRPGIVVTRVERQGFDYVVFGFRDEFAADPTPSAQRAGIPISKVRFRLEPYESLDPAFAARRQFARNEEAIGKSVIRFSQGNAALAPADLDAIDEIAQTLSSLREAARAMHLQIGIEVTGHTDEIGSGESNARLSNQRADGVRSALIAAGVDSAILTTRGVATSEPVRKGSSERDRSFNRSVTFRVTPARL